MIEIHTKLELKDYLKLSRTLMFRRGIVIVFMIIGVYAIAVSLITRLWFPQTFHNSGGLYTLLLGVFILLSYPVINYFNSKKIFNSHARLKEEITYQFTDENIKIAGESFSGEKTWDKVYKILELKDWILIYENKFVATILKKASFSSEQLQAFKNLVKSKNIKAKWKY